MEELGRAKRGEQGETHAHFKIHNQTNNARDFYGTR
jgi:hypothetical protein